MKQNTLRLTFAVALAIGLADRQVAGWREFRGPFFNLDPSKLAKDGSTITSLAQAKEAGAAVIAYGSFFNTVIDFTIVAV